MGKHIKSNTRKGNPKHPADYQTASTNFETLVPIFKPANSPLGVYAFHSQPPHVSNLKTTLNVTQKIELKHMIRAEMDRRKAVQNNSNDKRVSVHPIESVTEPSEVLQIKHKIASCPRLRIPSFKGHLSTKEDNEKQKLEKKNRKKSESKTDHRQRIVNPSHLDKKPRSKFSELLRCFSNESLNIMWRRDKPTQEESEEERDIVDFINRQNARRDKGEDVRGETLCIDEKTGVLKNMHKNSFSLDLDGTVSGYDDDFGNSDVLRPIMTVKEQLMLGLIPEQGWKKPKEKTRTVKNHRNKVSSKKIIKLDTKEETVLMKPPFKQKGVLEITGIKIVDSKKSEPEDLNVKQLNYPNYAQPVIQNEKPKSQVKGKNPKAKRHSSDHEAVAEAQKSLKEILLQNLPNPNFEIKVRTGRKEYKLRASKLKSHSDVQIPISHKPNVLNLNVMKDKDILFVKPSTPYQTRKVVETNAKQKNEFSTYEQPSGVKSVPIFGTNFQTGESHKHLRKTKFEKLYTISEPHTAVSPQVIREHTTHHCLEVPSPQLDNYMNRKTELEVEPDLIHEAVKSCDNSDINDVSNQEPSWDNNFQYDQSTQDFGSSGDATYRVPEPYFEYQFNPRPPNNFGPFIYASRPESGIQVSPPPVRYYFYDVPQISQAIPAFYQNPIGNQFTCSATSQPSFLSDLTQITNETDFLPKSTITEVFNDESAEETEMSTLYTKQIYLASDSESSSSKSDESIQDLEYDEVTNTQSKEDEDTEVPDSKKYTDLPEAACLTAPSYLLSTATANNLINQTEKRQAEELTNKTNKYDTSNRTLHYKFPLDENGSEVAIDVILPLGISPDDFTLDSPHVACAILQKAQDAITNSWKHNKALNDEDKGINSTSVVPMWCSVDIEEIFSECNLLPETTFIPLIHSDDYVEKLGDSKSEAKFINDDSFEILSKSLSSEFQGNFKISTFSRSDWARTFLQGLAIHDFFSNFKTLNRNSKDSNSMTNRRLWGYFCSCGCFRKPVKVAPAFFNLGDDEVTLQSMPMK